MKASPVYGTQWRFSPQPECHHVDSSSKGWLQDRRKPDLFHFSSSTTQQRRPLGTEFNRTPKPPLWSSQPCPNYSLSLASHPVSVI